MNYEISGSVLESGSQQAVPGVVVRAFDKEHIFDDLLGEVLTDREGRFHLAYDEEQFRSLFDKRPDIYLTVKSLSGKVLLTTKDATRFDATKKECFDLTVSAEILANAGLRAEQAKETVSREILTTLTCFTSADKSDDIVKQIETDIQGRESLLEVFSDYIRDLEGSKDNNALPYRKLARLFEAGKVPKTMTGHHYGVALGLRTGDLTGPAADYGNLLGYIWGRGIGPVVPWVGKTFAPMESGDRAQVLGSLVPEDTVVSRGINHFNTIEHAPVNWALNNLLTFMWHLKEVPNPERLRYGHEKNGGHFAAYNAPSVHASTPRDVLRLNYRYPGLDNNPPLTWLVDELVEIGDGLYLGQLLFSTARWLERYSPREGIETYKYQHFGYFLLWDERWNSEGKRLFPHLEIPGAAVVANIAGAAPVLSTTDKFKTLTLVDDGDGHVDPVAIADVKRELANSESIIHLLRDYSDSFNDLKVENSNLPKLQALFNAGIPPTTMNGFYRGALVSWLSDRFLASFDVNVVGAAWQMIRTLSPWTGKFFEPISKEQLTKLTGGQETNVKDTFFCANTTVFRNSRERFVRHLAKAAHVWMEDASEEEKRKYGYDTRTFFFLGKPATSVDPNNKNKSVFQFNYRWPELRNIPPDRYAMDEITQIADGLYLGQLFYATDWSKPWDPGLPHSDYKYGLFAYFLLMDEEWHARRLRIGFDVDNT